MKVFVFLNFLEILFTNLWPGFLRSCPYFRKIVESTSICDALQRKVTYVGECNFVSERKIADNLKEVKFQILVDTCSRYV